MSSSKHPYREIQVGCGDSVILRTVGRSALRHVLKMVVVESNKGILCAGHPFELPGPLSQLGTRCVNSEGR